MRFVRWCCVALIRYFLAGERVLPSLIDALRAFSLDGQEECAERAANAPFFSLIAAAAEMLDADLQLVQKNHAAAKKASGSGDVAQMEEHQEREPTEGGGGPPRNALTYEERVRLGGADRTELMSTINTFLPHNDRGPSGSNRRLVQSLAEILIWAHTSATRRHPQFVAALEQLTALAGCSTQEAEACVHKMQTIIRRLRKELSASARNQGFALSTEYTLNPTTITIKMLKRGKTGDLQLLRHLATKAGDTRMLQLLARRNREVGGAQPYDSIAALMRDWTPLNLQQEGSAEGEPDELAALDRELQQGSLLATIARLHLRLPPPPQQEERQQRTVTVACLETDPVNQAAAVVVAAAMQPAMITQESAAGSVEQQAAAAAAAAAVLEAADAALTNTATSVESGAVKGHVKGSAAAGAAAGGDGGGEGGEGGGGVGVGGAPSRGDEGGGSVAGPMLLLGEGRVDVSSFLNVLALIDGICARASASGARGAARLDAPATTTMVQNFIDRHVGPGDSLLLFTSSDIKLEARVLSQMQAQRSTIHVHINDDTMVCQCGFFFVLFSSTWSASICMSPVCSALERQPTVCMYVLTRLKRAHSPGWSAKRPGLVM